MQARRRSRRADSTRRISSTSPTYCTAACRSAQWLHTHAPALTRAAPHSATRAHAHGAQTSSIIRKAFAVAAQLALEIQATSGKLLKDFIIALETHEVRAYTPKPAMCGNFRPEPALESTAALCPWSVLPRCICHGLRDSHRHGRRRQDTHGNCNKRQHRPSRWRAFVFRVYGSSVRTSRLSRPRIRCADSKAMRTSHEEKKGLKMTANDGPPMVRLGLVPLVI